MDSGVICQTLNTAQMKDHLEEEEKCQTFRDLSMVVLRGSLECFMFWIKRKKKVKRLWLF